MAIAPSPATNNFSTQQLVAINQQAVGPQGGVPQGGQPQPRTMQPQPATQPAAGQTQAAPAEGGKKGKGKGKPDHAGGPKNAKALPPGLQGKDLPAGNPWKALADKLKQEQQQQGQPQPQAPGATNTALDLVA